MRRFMTIILAIGFMIPSLTAQNRQAEPPTSTPKNSAVLVKKQPGKKHWYQVGKASWYGSYFQGKETASGEAFDMNDLTAAHRQLPLGSVVRVTNLSNGNQVTVRINDRGPYFGSRIIDLSSKAAKLLGFRSRGIQTVRVEMVAMPVEVADQSSGSPSFP